MRHTTPDGGGLSRRRFMALGPRAPLSSPPARPDAPRPQHPQRLLGQEIIGEERNRDDQLSELGRLAISQPLVNQFQKAYPNVHVQVENGRRDGHAGGARGR